MDKANKRMLIINWIAGLLLLSISVYAQNTKLDFYSINDGLSQSSVNAIYQDNNGMIWIGTQDGLNLYDGHSFQVFKNIPFDSTSLADNFINCIFQDSKNRLWIGTSVGGVHLYLPEKNIFRRFRHQENDTCSISNNRIMRIYESPSQAIWIATLDGFNRLIEVEDNNFYFQRYNHYGSNLKKDAYNRTKCFFSNQEDELWVGSYNGLSRFYFNQDYSIKRVKQYFQKNYADTLEDLAIHSIFQDNKYNQLWAVSHFGVNLYSETKDRFKFFNKKATSGDEEEYIWRANVADGVIIGTGFDGVHKFPVEKGGVGRPSFTSKFELLGEETSFILDYQRDKLNPKIIWIGTVLDGLIKHKTIENRFKHNDLQQAKLAGLNSVAIFGIVKRKNGIIWLTDRQGLLRYNPVENTYEHFDAEDFELEHLEFRTIFEDSHENLWAGTNRGVIKFKYDKKGKLSHTDYFYAECKRNCGINSFFEESEGKLLITSFDGINIYDPIMDKLLDHPIIVDSAQFQKNSYGISFILKDKKNNVWVASKNGGLALYRDVPNVLTDLFNRKPEIFRHDEQDRSSLLSDDINMILEDQDGTIWLSTFIGIVKVEIKEHGLKFTNYTEKEGLCNNAVYGMLEDIKKQELWASTNNGLSRLNRKTNQFTTFRSEPGLQSNEFNGNGFFKAHDGEMFFAGINGYSSFYPSQLRKDSIVPKVSLRSLTTATGKTYNLSMQKEYVVNLPYRQNSFTINYVGIDFVYPEQVHYAYSIGDETETWISTNNDRSVVFTEFPSGEHRVRIRAANRDGVWSKKHATLLLRIQTPIWKTAWFYLALLAIVLLVAYILHKLRWQRKINKIKEFEELRMTTAQDFHDELGSKLTVISLFSQITKEKLNGEAKIVGPYLDKVIDTSNSLYSSMKDLLWAINPEQDSIYDLAIQLKDFGDELFDITTIKFSTEGIEKGLASRSLPINYKRHVLLIFKEAMNNILKHANSSEAHLKFSNKNEILKISIEDNGVGFCNTEVQEGDGLKNMKHRAQLLNSNLIVASSKASGTKITLACQLPKVTQPKRLKI